MLSELHTCSNCGKTKTLNQFSRNGSRKRTVCKVCSAAWVRDWRKRNEHYAALMRWTARGRWIHTRSKKLGVPYDLHEHRAELEKRLTKMTCEITGIALAYQKDDARLWNSPSLDRIVPEEGYVYSNVRIVAFGVNTLLGNWGEDDAYRIAKSFTDAFERNLEGV